MAENIGKVVVSIEARVEELEKGMARAEATVRRSAARIESNQKSLTKKIGKSWTELASKLNVITTVANIAEKAWNVVDGVLEQVTDSTKNASDKIMGSMKVVENSSIPIVSQFMKIGHGIHEWISGEKKLREEIERTTHALEARAKTALEGYNKRRKIREEFSGFVKEASRAIEAENSLIKETTNVGKLQLAQDAERSALQKKYNEQLVRANAARSKTSKDFFKRIEDEFNAAVAVLDETHQLEMSLAEKADKQAEENEAKRLQAIEDRIKAEIKAAEDEAKRLARLAQQVQNQTDDLQTKLEQLTLEGLGLDLESKLTGIHAKFDRLRQNANAEQIALLNQIEALEVKRAKAVQTETDARKKDRESAKIAAEKSTLQDLTTQVTVKTLEAAGQTMAAELVSIHAKFKKMREGATAQQLTQIAKLEQLEKSAALQRGAIKPDKADTAQTQTVATALGSFTVGLDHQAVVAKQSVLQSTLLGRILSASAKSNTSVSQTATAAKSQVRLLGQVNAWLKNITGQVATSTSASPLAKVDPNIEAASKIDESNSERMLNTTARIERKPEEFRSESETEKLSEFNELVKEITEGTKQQAKIQGQVNDWLSVMKDEQTKTQTTLPHSFKDEMFDIFKAKEVAAVDSEVRIIDMVSVSIPEKQIALLTEIADKTHAKEQMKVLEKIAASSAKVAQSLSSPTASGIIIAS